MIKRTEVVLGSNNGSVPSVRELKQPVDGPDVEEECVHAESKDHGLELLVDDDARSVDLFSRSVDTDGKVFEEAVEELACEYDIDRDEN